MNRLIVIVLCKARAFCVCGCRGMAGVAGVDQSFGREGVLLAASAMMRKTLYVRLLKSLEDKTLFLWF